MVNGPISDQIDSTNSEFSQNRKESDDFFNMQKPSSFRNYVDAFEPKKGKSFNQLIGKSQFGFKQ